MPVLVSCRLRRMTISTRRLIALAQRLLQDMGYAACELSVDIVGRSRIHRLNKIYRHKDAPTDVLAFPMREADGPATPLLGDVVIALPIAASQAARFGHSLDEELIRLLIHGTLHLLGYDHERSAKEARRMHRMERRLLDRLKPIPRLVKQKRRGSKSGITRNASI